MANPKNTPSPGWSGLLVSLGNIPRTFWFSVVGPLVLLLGGYFTWIQVGAPNLDRAMYGLKPENLIVTPKPPWIDADVVKEVFDGADLGRLSVLDREMSATVYNAFRTHPWIRKVFRIQKVSGCQVEVKVEYREPIAMIYLEQTGSAPNTKALTGSGIDFDETESRGPPQTISNKLAEKQGGDNQGAGKSASFVPVDMDGVLLPWRDFASDEVLRYWLLYAKNASNTGKVGAEYGDVRIKAALSLCKLLKDHREALGLERIYVYPTKDSNNAKSSVTWALEITSRNNQRFFWGNPPGLEIEGEPNARLKAERLIQLTQRPTPDQTKLTDFDLTKLSRPTMSGID